MVSSGIAAARQRCFLALPATLALCGLACASGADTGSTSDREIVVLWPRDAQDIDPRFTGDAYGLKLSRLLFASVVTVDPVRLEVVPDLAERVDVVSPTEYRVALRRGLRFGDGSVLDAADVAATYRSVVAPAFGTRWAATYRRVSRVETPDAHTVVFHLHAPHATFLTDLELPILRAEDERTHLGTPGDAPPVGSGPYRIVARRPGRIDLAPNPHWHRGAPRFGSVRIVVVQDDNTRALRMLAGAGDVAMNAVPPLLVPLFERDARFRVRSAPGVGTTYLGMNLEARAVADVRVRRAIGHAIDRAAIVRAKLGGRARLARSWIVPGHWAYASDAPDLSYDPTRSRALLDDAGHVALPGASRLRVSLRCGSERSAQSNARAIAAMLREVGIEAEVRPTETATLIADLNQGRFELTLLQVPEVVEPNVLSWFFGSDRIPGPGVEGANRWRLRDARLDAALERGRRSVNRRERHAAYADAQRILADRLPVISLWHEDVVAVTSARAAGFRVPRDGRYATLAW
jgi:peptide/nickel transport system substrate-binding protein